MDRSTATPSLELLLRQRDWLRRLAASLAVDAAHADDLTQQVLVAALERPAVEVGHARAWLATVVRRIARRERIDAKQRNARERAVAADERLPPSDEIVARAELQHEVSTALLALAEPYRTALLLRFFDDLKPAAIARVVAAPVETVRTRIKRGLELLRETLVAARAAPSAGRRAPREWAVALVGLLDSKLRRAVRRAVVAKSSAATFAAGGVGTLGALGIVGMSLKFKLAIAALVVVMGTFAGWRLLPAGAREVDGRRLEAVNAGASEPIATAAVARSSAPTPTIEATRSPAETESAAASKSDDPSAPATCEIVGTVRTASDVPAVGAIVFLEQLSDRNGIGSFGANRGVYATRDSMCDSVFSPRSSSGTEIDRCLVKADGRFRFAGIKARVRFNVAAIHRDEGTALVTDLFAEPAPQSRRVDLVLVPGVIVHGTVRDERGEPVEGASVTVNHIATIETHDGPHSSGSENRGRRVGEITTDATGSFRTIPLPFARLGIGVNAPGFFDGGAPTFDVPTGEHDHLLEIRLVHAPTLRGRVLGSGGGPADLARAIPEADDHGRGGLEVFASVNDPCAGDFHHLCGERGTLDFARDRYEVVPHDPNPSERPKRFISIWSRTVCLGAAKIVDPDAELDVAIDLSKLLPAPAVKTSASAFSPSRGVLIVAAVDARDGSPIGSFEVDCSSAGPYAGCYSEVRHVSDPGGIARVADRARVADLAGVSFHVFVWADGFAPARRDVTVRATTIADASAETVRFELSPVLARVAGRVENADGRPLEFVDVTLLTPDGELALPGDDGHCAVDGDGRFVFDRIGAGEYVVVASAFRDGPASAHLTTKTPADATRLRLMPGIDVTVKPFRRGGPLNGPFNLRIRDDNDVPIIDPFRFAVASWTGDRGSRVRLAPGSYTAEIFCPGFEVGRTSFAATADAVVEVEIVPLPEGASGR